MRTESAYYFFLKEIYCNCHSHRRSCAKTKTLIEEGTSEIHHFHIETPNFHSHAFGQISSTFGLKKVICCSIPEQWQMVFVS